MRHGGSYDRRAALREEIARQPGTSAAERLWFNKRMKLTGREPIEVRQLILSVLRASLESREHGPSPTG
jgi:hypothetical protein